MTPDPEFSNLALEKMERVLGGARATHLFSEILTEIGLEELSSADDLLLFSRALSGRGAFEGAVGAMLSVQAVMRGAKSE